MSAKWYSLPLADTSMANRGENEIEKRFTLSHSIVNPHRYMFFNSQPDKTLRTFNGSINC